MKSKESPYMKLLKAEKCCGKKMKLFEFYSNGVDSNTAVCKKCRSYIKIERGELDEEELDDDD